MKLILLKKVKKLGNANDIVDVKNGYAMNFLIPQKMAIVATPKKIKELEIKTQDTINKKQEDKKNLQSLIDKLENKKIIIKRQASEKGKLFAAITQDEILAALKNNFKIDLSKYKIKLNEHIKEVGEYKIDLKIEKDKIQLTIIVITV